MSQEFLRCCLLLVYALTTCTASYDGWGPWSKYSACSRTCGGGIQHTARTCLRGRRRDHLCQGPAIQYRSCNVQPCPEDATDFRLTQCQAYNGVSVPHLGSISSMWKPVYDPSKPCALVCQNEDGEVLTLKKRAEDGTSCDSLQTFGTCIRGVCKPVGCDRTLGSVKAEDKCLVCGGDGSHCQTVSGSSLSQPLSDDVVNELITFPVEARSLRITLSLQPHTILELEDNSGKTLKLSQPKFSFGPRKAVEYGGALFGYSIEEGTTTFYARGPLREAMKLKLRYLRSKPKVEFEYSVLQESRPQGDAANRYIWSFGRWTSCSVECGKGYQRRAVACLDRESRTRARDDKCGLTRMPSRRRVCSQAPCQDTANGGYRWVPGNWGECDVPCGMGTQSQDMLCVERSHTGQSVYVAEDLCLRYVGDKPLYERACSGEDCSYWAAGSWGECSVTCGRGQQRRRLYCQRDPPDESKPPVVLSNDQCPSEEKPDEVRTCDTGADCPDRSRTGPAEVREPDCRRSRYGCCPDGRTPARGSRYRGCPRTVVRPVSGRRNACERSQYGCCRDGVNIARGPNDEGCPDRERLVGGCAGTRHGCCDDNVTSARGPNKEGCPETRDCANTRYGCCEDMVTAARGNNKEGCPEYRDRQIVGGCAGTRYGCCEDRVTAATGENSYGCPEYRERRPLVGGCAGTRYGCCDDRVTAARGRNKEGCAEYRPRPIVGGCAGTRYGCCEDRVTAARGENSYGCPEYRDSRLIGGCAGTRYGCCEDRVTAARGENSYGCPEYRERRPIGGCAGTRYGCCEDRVTAARGENSYGCPEYRERRPIGGCAGTRYGCCEDRVTAARGENSYGCPEYRERRPTRIVGGCAGTRYGCCEDRTTAARGENGYGCPEYRKPGCQTSEHGCCRDGETAASGPNRQGCPETPRPIYGGCAGTRYGCCPDGVTGARDENGLGCPDFDPALCGLPKSHGSCSNYTKQYFYSTKYGVCRPFWYHGCKGNANRFSTLPECQKKCQHVKLPAACRLPNVTGPCKYGQQQRYFFNPGTNRCEQFQYGGCRGNANNFRTMAACRSACNGAIADKPANVRAASPCDAQPCQNGFRCEDLSNGSYSCSCNPDWGQNCQRPPPYWCLSDRECGRDLKCVREKECRDGNCHIYARCVASSSRFPCDRDPCTRDKDCVNDGRSHMCVDPVRFQRAQPVVLDCSLSKYGCCPDQRTPATGPDNRGCAIDCRTWRYGCCPDGVTAADADRSNCEDQVEGSGAEILCERTAHGCCDDGVTIRGIAGCPDSPDGESRDRVDPHGRGVPCERTVHGCCDDGVTIRGIAGCPDSNTRSSVSIAASCLADRPEGVCTGGWQERYRYNSSTEACQFFWWGSCGPEDNVFASEDECEVECASTAVVMPTDGGDTDFISICDMPQEPGPCRARQTRYYYNAQERRCLRFSYGGCQGNENNFESLVECQQECMGMGRQQETTTQAPVTRARVQNEMDLEGPSVVNEGDEIQIICTVTGPTQVIVEWHVNGRPVSDNDNVRLRGSSSLFSGGFSQQKELLVPRASVRDSGTYVCRAGAQRSRLDVSVRPRVRITTPRTTTTTTTTPAPGEVQNSITMDGNATVERGTPLRITCVARGPRRPSEIVWYHKSRIIQNPEQNGYQITTRQDPRDRHSLIGDLTVQAATGDFAGTYYCRAKPHGNYKGMNVQVVERTVTDETDESENIETEITESDDPNVVCKMQPKQGNCLADIKRYYYDNMEGACKTFSYGGCRGNSNNFATLGECNRFCSAREVCGQPKYVGRCRAAMPRFYFDAVDGKCMSFIYGGCDGNLNNFETQAACERRCAPYLTAVNEVIPSGRGQGGEGEQEDVCALIPDKGRCKGYFIKYYYSYPRRRCERFVYTGCEGNDNRFDTIDECQDRCERTSESRRPTDPPRRLVAATTTRATTTTTEARPVSGRDVCLLAKDSGRCDDWKIYFYFDEETRRCRRFYYGGCGGNENRFTTREECLATCGSLQARTTQAPRPRTCRSSRYGCCDDGVTYARDSRGSNCPERTTEAPRPTSCRFTRYGCCDDGVTFARDWRKSNCRETNIVIPSNGERATEVRVSRGDTTLLTCSLRDQTVTWYRDTYRLRESRNFRIHSNGTLELRDVSDSMAGAYTCRVTLPNNEPRLQRFTVEVNVPVSIISGPALMRVNPLDNAYLYCQVTGSPTPRVSWSKDGRLIRPTRRHQVWGNGTLMISAVAEDDVGSYVCTAENNVHNPVRKEVMLKLKENLEADIRRHRGSYMEGDQIRLTCDVSGYPEPELEWHKDGRVLNTGGKIKVEAGRLTILSASIDDAGLYKCVASNDGSTADDITTVQIRMHSPATKCTDTANETSCRLITSGRLCGIRMFGERCCQSCRRAGYL